MKTCTKCGVTKDLDQFFKSKKGALGRRGDCKQCCNQYNKAYCQDNSIKIQKRASKYYKDNKDTIKTREKEYRTKESTKIKRRQSYKNRYNEDENFKVGQRLRTRIYHAMKGVTKSDTTENLLGCTITEFVKYLENKFEEGMSCANYVNPNGDQTDCWHIDHIKACAKFDLSKPDEQARCFHYSNMQPLWAKENLTKWAN